MLCKSQKNFSLCGALIFHAMHGIYCEPNEIYNWNAIMAMALLNFF